VKKVKLSLFACGVCFLLNACTINVGQPSVSYDLTAESVVQDADEFPETVATGDLYESMRAITESLSLYGKDDQKGVVLNILPVKNLDNNLNSESPWGGRDTPDLLLNTALKMFHPGSIEMRLANTGGRRCVDVPQTGLISKEVSDNRKKYALEISLHSNQNTRINGSSLEGFGDENDTSFGLGRGTGGSLSSYYATATLFDCEKNRFDDAFGRKVSISTVDKSSNEFLMPIPYGIYTFNTQSATADEGAAKERVYALILALTAQKIINLPDKIFNTYVFEERFNMDYDFSVCSMPDDSVVDLYSVTIEGPLERFNDVRIKTTYTDYSGKVFEYRMPKTEYDETELKSHHLPGDRITHFFKGRAVMDYVFSNIHSIKQIKSVLLLDNAKRQHVIVNNPNIYSNTPTGACYEPY
jgi:hypothetical protein